MESGGTLICRISGCCPQIPFYGSYQETDPAVIAQQGVERFKKESRSVAVSVAGQVDDLF